MRRITRPPRRARRWPIGLAALGLVAAGCIPPDPDPNEAAIDGDGELTLVMNEFSFLPSRVVVDAGSTVRITLINEGRIEHELMAGRVVADGGGYVHDILAAMLDGGTVRDIAESSATDDGHDETNSDGHHDEPAPAHDPDDGHHDEPATAEHDPDDGHHDEDPMGEDPMGDDQMGDDPPAGHDEDEMGDHDPDDGHHDEDEMGEHDPDDGHHDEEADDHHAGGHAGAHVTLQPGESTTIAVHVPIDAAGVWQIGCFLEGHFEAGMHGTLIVRSPAA